MNYQYEVEMAEGRLVISVLRPEWLQRAADLLTDCFVDTKGIQPYRRYVRRNISTYLEQHSKMPPAAVVLTAILHSKVCAYLCNMAVSSQWQRRGVASRLISAVEDLCVLAAEREVYLHLRFKDKDTAGGLYSKAGFSAAAADWPILTLLGQQPRYLMKKVLPADRPLVGSLRLPDAAPSIAAAAAAVLPEETLQAADAPGEVKQPATAAAAPAPAS
eukprot:gene4123-4369_t